MKSFVLTPAAGKRLIGRAVARHPDVRSAFTRGTLVVVAGTTNGYVAEEIFKELDGENRFSRSGFYRGLTVAPQPPEQKATPEGDQAEFSGDVIIREGVWQKGLTLFDVVEELKEGDMVLKGANALDLIHRRAAVLVGHPQGGTLIAILQRLLGCRIRLILPVGIEKRVPESLDRLAVTANFPGSSGPRLMPVPGEIFTELDAIQMLSGARADIMAAGGVCGAEGSCWLAVQGEPAQIEAAGELIKQVAAEPQFEF